MSSDYTTGSPRSSGTLKRIIIVMSIAFLVGLGIMGWAVSRWAPARELLLGESTQPVAVNTAPSTLAPSRALPPPTLLPNANDSRIDALEARIDRLVNVSTGTGTSARAEGLLIAFAARRAIDRGLSLGYLEGALQQHFGSTQPRAVGVVIGAAQRPVTLDQLRTDLDAVAPKLLSSMPNKNWTERVRESLSNLIIVRKAGAPSTQPTERLARAGRMIDSGRVDVALTEVARLPGAANANAWMRNARQYAETHRALDILEASAIMQPGTQQSPKPLPPISPPEAATPKVPAAEPAGRDSLL